MHTKNSESPIRSGEPFYDALVARLAYEADGRVKYWGALYYAGSSDRIRFLLSDFQLVSLKDRSTVHERDANSRRELLRHGIGCLTLRLEPIDKDEPEQSYIVIRPADVVEDGVMVNQKLLYGQVPEAAQNPGAPITVQRGEGLELKLIPEPLQHPYLQEVYSEVTGSLE